jgi:hypothetical protein
MCVLRENLENVKLRCCDDEVGSKKMKSRRRGFVTGRISRMRSCLHDALYTLFFSSYTELSNRRLLYICASMQRMISQMGRTRKAAHDSAWRLATCLVVSLVILSCFILRTQYKRLGQPTRDCDQARHHRYCKQLWASNASCEKIS